jgi:hypothetical protein
MFRLDNYISSKTVTYRFDFSKKQSNSLSWQHFSKQNSSIKRLSNNAVGFCFKASISHISIISDLNCVLRFFFLSLFFWNRRTRRKKKSSSLRKWKNGKLENYVCNYIKFSPAFLYKCRNHNNCVAIREFIIIYLTKICIKAHKHAVLCHKYLCI